MPNQTRREVERDAVGAHREARGVAAEDGHHGPGEDEGGEGSAAAEDDAFREERTAQGGGVGSEGGADGQLGLAAHGSGQHEIGDVGAGDDEEQARGGEEHPQDGVGAGVDLVVHARHADLVVVGGLVDVGVGPDHGGVGGAELGACGFEGGSGSEAGEDLGHAVFAAGDHGGGQMMRAGDDVGDDLGRHRVGYGRLKHADDDGVARAGEAFEADALAEDVGDRSGGTLSRIYR